MEWLYQMIILKQHKPVGISKVALRRSLCREDYYTFVQTFWPEVVAETAVWNWHIRYVAGELQKICFGNWLWF